MRKPGILGGAVAHNNSTSSFVRPYVLGSISSGSDGRS